MKVLKKKYFLYATICLCFLGRGILFYFGYNMGALATSAVTKIHPATYFISLLFITRLISAPKSVMRVARPVKIYISSVLLLVVYLYVTGNATEISFIADALVMPGLFYAYAQSLKPETHRKLLKLALTLIMINAFWAMAEKVLSINIFPLVETSYGSSFRSTALLGHPLNNGLITLIFILYILVADFKTTQKNLYLAILFVSLICFGARGCLAVAAIAILLLYLFPLFFSKRRYFVKTNKSLAIAIIVILCSGLVYITLNTSFGDRLVKVSFFDSSADVRVQALNLIDFNALQDFLWARPQTKIDSMASEAGVAIIENFIIIWVLKFGLVFTVFILASLFYFLINCSEVRNKKIMFLVVLLFIAAATTNNSLAGNTQALIIFVAVFAYPSEKHRFIF